MKYSSVFRLSLLALLLAGAKTKMGKLVKEGTITDIDEIFENCDFITIHVPLLDSTKNMISAEGIAKMKKDAVILNFARNGQ